MATNNGRNNDRSADYLFDRNELLNGDNRSPLFVRLNILGAKALFWGGLIFFGLLGSLVNILS